eukprot:CAMPEP_0118872068 /NCGR_PEP_ID=MMETSP1163-20130328/14407_1 /TAXON_ID=124430 /ORGANISM="Phaeomonas parva, Strain CCMP2877" /LENGTH=45 /DNA_ID= /DNA_START= /DNA_END= /DNA_ORIENTATION=
MAGMSALHSGAPLAMSSLRLNIPRECGALALYCAGHSAWDAPRRR